MNKPAAAVILAGGSGRRMHSDVPKQYMEIGGHPLLYYSVKAFEESSVTDIVLVVNEGDEEKVYENIVSKYGFKKVSRVATGGKERFDSSWNGIRSVLDIFEQRNRSMDGYVLIHDAARAMISRDVIERTIADAVEYGACCTAVPSKDTVKIADENGFIKDTPVRDRVWIAQTPQAFDMRMITDAYEKMYKAIRNGQEIMVTDDASVAEMFSDVKVKLTMGDYENIKVTTPDDLITAEKILCNADRNK